MRKFLLISLAFLAGCTTANEQARAPLPSDANLRLVQTVKSSLKDPYSVRDAAFTIVKEKDGSYACVQLNAKNSFGAYAGMSRLFYYWDGKQWVLNGMKMGMEDWSRRNGLGSNACPGVTQPLPGLGK